MISVEVPDRRLGEPDEFECPVVEKYLHDSHRTLSTDTDPEVPQPVGRDRWRVSVRDWEVDLWLCDPW